MFVEWNMRIYLKVTLYINLQSIPKSSIGISYQKTSNQ